MNTLQPFSEARRRLREKWNKENTETGISWEDFLIKESFKLEREKLKR